MSYPRTIAALGLVAAAFAAAAGWYYQSELLVWWHALRAPAEQTAQQPTQPPVPAASQPVLTLRTLAEPLPLVETDTLDEAVIQEKLKEGAVILPLGRSFGEAGNMVVTAHSSGTTAFGPYRFAFAKLSELEEGQTFMVKLPEATYTYEVFGKEIVWPHEVDKLPNDERSTVTLVTCWPLWTNFKRLLVHGELIDVQYNETHPS